MTVGQAEAILAAAREHESDSFLASQEQGSGLVEASLVATTEASALARTAVHP
jgi:phage terminase large subunit-like protein